MPVFRNLPRVDTLVTFITMQPTSAGSPGLPEGPTCGTSRPVQVSTSVFSAPCGYRIGSGLTRTPSTPRVRVHIRSMHSGLLRSMPMMQCGISQYFITAWMPAKMDSLHSSISRASVAR